MVPTTLCTRTPLSSLYLGMAAIPTACIGPRWNTNNEQRPVRIVDNATRQIHRRYLSLLFRTAAGRIIGTAMHDESKKETHLSRRRRRGRRRQPLWSNGQSTTVTMLMHLLMLFWFLADRPTGTVTGFSVLPAYPTIDVRRMTSCCN
uniref:Uncharacterized protein n=1 Tax=Anopheles maculatus TaxID=74869 RepID=A0A182SU28_9DIPT